VADGLGVPHAFDDWADLAAADLDLVSITTPPHLHHAMALGALDAGRHVLCEKPMALSAAEAEEMLARGERARRVHVIDHELRFNPNRRKARALIEQGFVGAPRHVLLTAVNASRLDPAKPWGWWFDETRGGGLLGAVGSHQVDLLRYWLREIEAVTGTAVPFVPERPLPDGTGRRPVTADEFTTFSLRFRSGAVGTVFLSAVATHAVGPRVEVWGDEGHLVLDEGERLWGAHRGQALRELTEPETVTPPPGMEYVPLWGLSFVRLVEHLVQAVLDGAPIAPAATFRDGVAVQRVLDAVRRASRAGWIPA
jgi:predicted dehydrogenase